MKINTNSWHYRIVDKTIQKYGYPKSLCGYIFDVAAKLFEYFMFYVGMPGFLCTVAGIPVYTTIFDPQKFGVLDILFAMPIGAIAIILAILCVIITALCVTGLFHVTCYLVKLTKIGYFCKRMYKSIKCPKVEFVDTK